MDILFTKLWVVGQLFAGLTRDCGIPGPEFLFAVQASRYFPVAFVEDVSLSQAWYIYLRST